MGVLLRGEDVTGVTFRIYPPLKELTGLAVKNLAGLVQYTGVLVEVTTEIPNKCIQCVGHGLPFRISAQSTKAIST